MKTNTPKRQPPVPGIRLHPISCGLGYAFLIESPGGLVVVDAGSPGQEGLLLAKMRALGRSDLRLIWITHAHYDHYGSAAALRDLTGAPIGAHPADAGSLARGLSPLGSTRGRGHFFRLAQPVLSRLMPLPPAPPDITLADGDTLAAFGLDAAVLHTPGHTPGHTCLLLPGGAALVGDLISAFPYLAPQKLLAVDWSQIPASLARLQAARPEWIYTGHSPRPIAGCRLQRLRAPK